MKLSPVVLLLWSIAGPVVAQETAQTEESNRNSPADFRSALTKLQKELAPLASLALLPVELNGTNEGQKFVEQALLETLKTEGRRLIEPAEVFKRLGVEFQLSEEALGQMAQSLDVEAVVFPRIFATPQAVEVHIWVVTREGKTIFEETFPIELPPANETATNETDTSKSTPVKALGKSRPRHVPLLALAPRILSGSGVSVGFATGHVSMGVYTPTEESQDWIITEDGQPISEARLAELAGRKDILEKMLKEAGRYRTWRNVGIGLALSGFIVTAAALPYYKQGSDQGVTVASAAVAGGAALGATGLILWITYGQLAANAFTPFPSRHSIDLDEAQKMIDEVNERRWKEFSRSFDDGTARFRLGLIPGPGSVGVALGGSF